MKTTIFIDDAQKILLKRHLNKNGQAQMKFSKECAKYMNNYVPFDTGKLKDLSVTVNKNNVTYDTPYARKQYYTNAGNGRKANGRRGSFWDRRMWAAHGNAIVQTIADFCGGHV